LAATLPEDEVTRREDAWLAYDAAYHPDPRARAAAAALLDDLPDDVRPREIEMIGDGPYRAPDVARALGELLVAYRKRHRLSQRALARRLLVHQSQVARLESGERTPSLETLVRVARELDLSLVVHVTSTGAALVAAPSGAHGTRTSPAAG
jgi:ribosome-binding protein aMBF1 (putative translation factor)